MLIVGALLIAAAILDAFWTTLAFSGGGPITRRLARGLWAAALALHRAGGSTAHGLLKFVGTPILLGTVFCWIVMLFAGYLMIFSAAAGAVVRSSDGMTADFAQRFYFTGYTLFTLGLGDFVPGGNGWRVVTVIATMNGLFLVTLAITYLLPVISATAQTGQLAAVISSRDQPAGAHSAGLGREGFSGLTNYLTQITQMIDLHTQRHLAYPVLHYFHSGERRTAVAPSLAVLQDALIILSAGVAPGERLRAIDLEPAARALEGLLRVLRDHYVSPADEPPPFADLAPLREGGIPLVAEAEFRRRLEEYREVRCLFRSYVKFGGWQWDTVVPRNPDPKKAANDQLTRVSARLTARSCFISRERK